MFFDIFHTYHLILPDLTYGSPINHFGNVSFRCFPQWSCHVLQTFSSTLQWVWVKLKPPNIWTAGSSPFQCTRAAHLGSDSPFFLDRPIKDSPPPARPPPRPKSPDGRRPGGLGAPASSCAAPRHSHSSELWQALAAEPKATTLGWSLAARRKRARARARVVRAVGRSEEPGSQLGTHHFWQCAFFWDWGGALKVNKQKPNTHLICRLACKKRGE